MTVIKKIRHHRKITRPLLLLLLSFSLNTTLLVCVCIICKPLAESTFSHAASVIETFAQVLSVWLSLSQLDNSFRKLFYSSKIEIEMAKRKRKRKMRSRPEHSSYYL